MDAISNTELIELTLSATDHIYAQFQFWLSITFALIAACFIAREQLGSRVRIALGILYFATTLLIARRLIASGLNATVLTNEIHARDIVWYSEATVWIGVYQMGLIVFGVSAALWFLYSTLNSNGT